MNQAIAYFAFKPRPNATPSNIAGHHAVVSKSAAKATSANAQHKSSGTSVEMIPAENDTPGSRAKAIADSAPTREQAEADRHAAEAAKYLAEGDAELAAMLGMEQAKREIKLIKATTKVNLARAKMGLPVPVTSRHTLLLGPPGTGKT